MTATAHAEDALVLRQEEAGVATLTLNRLKQYNALSQAMLGALQAALDAVAADKTVRVVAIAGAGPAFCAGHDLKEMRAQTDPAFHQALFTQCGWVMLTINRLPQQRGCPRRHRRLHRQAQTDLERLLNRPTRLGYHRYSTATTNEDNIA